jgi:hypothetical protein
MFPGFMPANEQVKGIPQLIKILKDNLKKDEGSTMNQSLNFLLAVIEKRREDVMALKGETADHMRKLDFVYSSHSFARDARFSQPTISQYI